MGSIALVILSMAFFGILLILIGKLIDKLGYSKRIINMLKRKLFWNTFLRTSLQVYIKVLYVYLVFALSLNFKGFVDSIKSIFTILIIGSLVALPAIYTFLL